MKEQWTVKVEFDFSVDTDPSVPRHEGDAQVDFNSRAIEEGLLPRLRKAFPGDDGVNWMVDKTTARRLT